MMLPRLSESTDVHVPRDTAVSAHGAALFGDAAVRPQSCQRSAYLAVWSMRPVSALRL
jgi:hypothetical protein